MCEVLNVPRSSYYEWLKRPIEKDVELKELIKAIFYESRETYGVRRVHAELLSRGINVGHNKVGSIKKELNLYPKTKPIKKEEINSPFDAGFPFTTFFVKE